MASRLWFVEFGARKENQMRLLEASAGTKQQVNGLLCFCVYSNFWLAFPTVVIWSKSWPLLHPTVSARPTLPPTILIKVSVRKMVQAFDLQMKHTCFKYCVMMNIFQNAMDQKSCQIKLPRSSQQHPALVTGALTIKLLLVHPWHTSIVDRGY